MEILVNSSRNYFQWIISKKLFLVGSLRSVRDSSLGLVEVKYSVGALREFQSRLLGGYLRSKEFITIFKTFIFIFFLIRYANIICNSQCKFIKNNCGSIACSHNICGVKFMKAQP